MTYKILTWFFAFISINSLAGARDTIFIDYNLYSDASLTDVIRSNVSTSTLKSIGVGDSITYLTKNDRNKEIFLFVLFRDKNSVRQIIHKEFNTVSYYKFNESHLIQMDFALGGMIVKSHQFSNGRYFRSTDYSKKGNAICEYFYSLSNETLVRVEYLGKNKKSFKSLNINGVVYVEFCGNESVFTIGIDSNRIVFLSEKNDNHEIIKQGSFNSPKIYDLFLSQITIESFQQISGNVNYNGVVTQEFEH